LATFPDKIFSDICLTFSKIPDISLTAVNFPDISRFSRQVVTLHVNQTGSVALHVKLFKSNAADITVRCGQVLTMMVRHGLLKSVQSRCSLSWCCCYFDDTITSPFHDRRLSTTAA